MTHGSSRANLVLATVAFAVAFAVWGLISALTPILKTELNLTATEASLMIAIPVLMGSAGRLVTGLLTDRYGGRLMYSIVLMFSVVPATVLAFNHSYPSLLICGLFMGVAGSAFSIGVAFVSRWFPPEKQGTALGVYGAGNVGQSVAVFFGPVLAHSVGIPVTFTLFGVVSLTWGLVFALWARNARSTAGAASLRDNLRVLRTERRSWALSMLYFLTFGGFVALGVYLPTMLRDVFSLTPEDAGARTAGFVLLATACRPTGGWISDRIGGQRLLVGVFGGLALIAWLMAMQQIHMFTFGALGCAALLGLGNGGVFKLVPQYFPRRVGTITGLVATMGGLGGFFPPLLLGVLRDRTGSYTLGFVFLCAFALACLLVLWLVFIRVPARAGVAGEAANS